MGALTTHVLDTGAGRPAAGVRIDLYRLEDGTRHRVRSAVTNADGRCGEPLLQGRELVRGVFELEFHVGDYFAGRGAELSDPPFLDCVTVRVGIGDPGEHYHVPLLVSPWSYSTYRGS